MNVKQLCATHNPFIEPRRKGEQHWLQLMIHLHVSSKIASVNSNQMIGQRSSLNSSQGDIALCQGIYSYAGIRGWGGGEGKEAFGLGENAWDA